MNTNPTADMVVANFQINNGYPTPITWFNMSKQSTSKLFKHFHTYIRYPVSQGGSFHVYNVLLHKHLRVALNRDNKMSISKQQNTSRF